MNEQEARETIQRIREMKESLDRDILIYGNSFECFYHGRVCPTEVKWNAHGGPVCPHCEEDTQLEMMRRDKPEQYTYGQHFFVSGRKLDLRPLHMLLAMQSTRNRWQGRELFGLTMVLHFNGMYDFADNFEPWGYR